MSHESGLIGLHVRVEISYEPVSRIVRHSAKRQEGYLKWRNITGAGFLRGIGFTMSIFITLLAYTNDDLVNNSKIAVIVASILAGTIGYTILKLTLKQEVKE